MWARWLLLVCGLAFGAMAQTTAPAQDPPALDLQEELLRFPVTVKDLYGRQETRDMPVTVFRPAGGGPFPLVVLNHGRATADRRATQGRARYEHLARYLVSKGLVVMVPTRIGYWETYGDFDPESAGNCNALRLEPMATAASDQVLATVAYAARLPYVDTRRWLVMGVSVGGLTAVATAWRRPPGLLAAVNFSGGAGGDPDKHPQQPCSPQAMARLLQDKAAAAAVPMLWLYWANDLYWGEDWPRRWHAAWVQGGGVAELQMLPAHGKDGHSGATSDMDHWVPVVERYLAQHGLTAPGTVARPAASAYAAVDAVDRVPISQANRDGLYQRFLAAQRPRAFAIGRKGSVGYASGDWALGRALGYCQARRADSCRLYAVDDEVVWTPE